MEINLDKTGSVTILRVNEPRLDTTLAPDLKTHLLSMVETEAPKILLDLRDVEYADSSGLGAILFGIRQARDNGGACKLVNVNARVLSLIKIAKLDHVIEAFDNEPEAIDSFSMDA